MSRAQWARRAGMPPQLGAGRRVERDEIAIQRRHDQDLLRVGRRADRRIAPLEAELVELYVTPPLTTEIEGGDLVGAVDDVDRVTGDDRRCVDRDRRVVGVAPEAL